MKSPLPTDFAQAERAETAEIIQAARELKGNPMTALFNAIPVPLLVINSSRQIVFCNAVFQSTSVFKTSDEILGMRPGEALGCIHSHVHEGGCGTSKFCRDCGAASAIIKSLEGEHATEECRILRGKNLEEEALDLQVFTSPFKFNGFDFILFTVLDISHEKRQQSLERIFFHDVMNLVTGLKYTAQMVCKTTTSGFVEDKCRVMDKTITQIAEEIQTQKALSRAEDGQLAVHPQKTSTGAILTRMREIFSSHTLCQDKFISISEKSDIVDFETDPVILNRILGNMIKNALEASEKNSGITIGAGAQDGEIQFWVHNDHIMTEKVKRQIFKRSFSTKGQGRGLGTYSMKLLTESYLNGTVSFKSSPVTGTVFTITLPTKA
ncbi:sensor histidine kinase [Maridesulfovibrio sp. FT414]|uniref:sensor histidine kinase n=1 Tax=Maridesulfovibrio sp. FT414 TaxID=2979469 RepID=UPI003D809D74